MTTTTKAELHAKDVRDGYLDLVQAGGRVHVVRPDPEMVGRWETIATLATLAEAAAYRDGYRAAREAPCSASEAG